MKLLCQQHSTVEAEGLCWIDPQSKHIPLFPNDISLWAEYMVSFLEFLPGLIVPTDKLHRLLRTLPQQPSATNCLTLITS